MSLASLLSHRAYDRKLQREAQVSLWCQRGSIIMEARNACVGKADEVGATHIWFLDSDLSFPITTLDRLLAHHVDIVGGNYVRRGTEPGELLGQVNADMMGTSKTGLQPMLHMPIGCCLISMKVFHQMRKPYFRYLTSEHETVSEDTYFTMNARAANFPVWQDTSLTREIGHIGTKVYRPS